MIMAGANMKVGADVQSHVELLQRNGSSPSKEVAGWAESCATWEIWKNQLESSPRSLTKQIYLVLFGLGLLTRKCMYSQKN